MCRTDIFLISFQKRVNLSDPSPVKIQVHHFQGLRIELIICDGASISTAVDYQELTNTIGESMFYIFC